MVKNPKSVLRRIIGLASLAAAIGAWILLAPQTIGGDVAYAVVTGESMEPGLSASDLVIVREQPSYGVGDAIAYRSEHLGQIVLHRVVAEEGNRFVMKGDNNDFLDADRPSAGQVLGKRWVHIPKAGAAFTFLRSTVGMALGGVGVLGLLGFFSVKERRRRRNGKHRRVDSDRDAVDEPPIPAVPRVAGADASLKPRRAQVVAVVVCAAVAVSAGVSVLSFNRPLFRAETTDIDLVHRGEFEYSAPVPAGPVYQSSRLAAGDPVFVRLIRDLEVGFDYALDARAAHDLELTGSMKAVLRSDNGWVRTMDIAPLATSSDDSLHLAGRLDLGDVKATLREVERLTGMAPGTYSLSLEPRISVEGSVGGQPVGDTFAPALPFQLNDIQLGLVRPQEGGLQDGLKQILTPTEKTTVTVDRVAPNPFNVLGRDVPVLAVRRVSLVAVAFCLLALLCLAILWVRRRPKDEAARIQARYASLLIPVTDAPELKQETVDVADIETLARLSQQFEQPIMHQQLVGEGHSYSLYYDGLLYRYRIIGDTDDIPVLRFEPLIASDRPVVRAVLTRPTRPESDGAAGDSVEISG